MSGQDESLKEQLADLLQEVRSRTNHIDRQARNLINPRIDESTYRQALHTLLRELLQSRVTREQVVGFACAAELGFRLQPPADMVSRVSGSFGLRVLYWTVQRRMRRMSVMQPR